MAAAPAMAAAVALGPDAEPGVGPQAAGATPGPRAAIVAAGERMTGPTCGQPETEHGRVIGWSCMICGGRQARG